MQQRKVIATWNSDRDLWETDQTSLFEPLAVFSETWPTSGMTRNGTAYELPTSERHTADTESSSLLPTPAASQGAALRSSPSEYADLGRTIYKLLPTPIVTDGDGEGPSLINRNTLVLRTLSDMTPAVHAHLSKLTPQQRGETISQLSKDGNGQWDDPHQDQHS